MQRPKLNYSALRRINVVRHVLNHTVGHDHPLWSRLIFGSIIMVLSKLIIDSEIVLAAMKELVHAIGAIPWLEWFIEYSNTPNTTQNAKDNRKTTVSETD